MNHNRWHSPILCSVCDKEFVPTGSYQKYCPECKVEAERSRNHRYDVNWRLLNPKGQKRIEHRAKAKRRSLGFIPLNSPFEGCEGHHIDKDRVIHIPSKLHQSIRHNVFTGKNMETINALASQFLHLSQ